MQNLDSTKIEPTITAPCICVNCRFFESYAAMHTDVTQPWDLGVCKSMAIRPPVRIEDSCKQFENK